MGVEIKAGPPPLRSPEALPDEGLLEAWQVTVSNGRAKWLQVKGCEYGLWHAWAPSLPCTAQYSTGGPLAQHGHLLEKALVFPELSWQDPR